MTELSLDYVISTFLNENENENNTKGKSDQARETTSGLPRRGKSVYLTFFLLSEESSSFTRPMSNHEF
jgi:hypothetical protein